MAKTPAGKALPVLEDGQGLTVTMALRHFPGLQRRRAEVLAAVPRYLKAIAQRPGGHLLLVYDEAEIMKLLTEMDAPRSVRTKGIWTPADDRKTIARLREPDPLLAQLRRIDDQVIVTRMDRMRSAGLSWRQIAERLGYTPPDGALDAYRRSKRRAGVLDADDVLEWAEGGLLGIYEQFRRQAEFPGYLHDIRGQLLLDPDGNPEVNEDARQKALHGQVKVIEVETRLRGVIAPTKREVTHDIGPLEQRLLAAYAQLEQRAIASAQGGDVVLGEVLGDDEAEDEGEQPGGQEPAGPAADDPGVEQGIQEQQEG